MDLVIGSFQPQPEAVACQPTIIERVYEIGSTVNKTDVSELTAALNDVAEELRSSRIELARHAESDFTGAVSVASNIRNHSIPVAGISESFVLKNLRSSGPLKWSALRPETTLDLFMGCEGYNTPVGLSNSVKNYVVAEGG
ncbi:hypothetical protein [Enterobacter hormaechei]|uniref:hypothetical protein n=1 Tax=Enterobacter hormaechei TaxID=158836 RepID=UPI003F660BA1